MNIKVLKWVLVGFCLQWKEHTLVNKGAAASVSQKQTGSEENTFLVVWLTNTSRCDACVSCMFYTNSNEWLSSFNIIFICFISIQLYRGNLMLQSHVVASRGRVWLAVPWACVCSLMLASSRPIWPFHPLRVHFIHLHTSPAHGRIKPRHVCCNMCCLFLFYHRRGFLFDAHRFITGIKPKYAKSRNIWYMYMDYLMSLHWKLKEQQEKKQPSLSFICDLIFLQKVETTTNFCAFRFDNVTLSLGNKSNTILIFPADYLK